MTIYKLNGTDFSESFCADNCVIPDLPDAPLCIALGNFDGVHLGHRELLARTAEEKNILPGSVSAVWTFFPHNTVSIKNAPLLTGLTDRLKLFAKAGIDYAIFTEFESVREMSPEQFVKDILLGLNAKTVICGYNYRFGYLGRGDTEKLTDLLANNCKTVVIPPVKVNGQTVNSTLIRKYIESGQTDKASLLLGRPFSICLPVIHGNEIGRKIGVPTINQSFPQGYIVPEKGVYICSCMIDGKILPAITNVGSRPTVNNDESKINCETHIIDYSSYLYGETVQIFFHEKIRGEIKFPDIQALKKQIENDMITARAYFAEHDILLK